MMLGTLILSAMSLLSAFVGLGHGYVRTIGLTDGLSSQAVYALHQDAQGYMWAGTYEGLNRLDGRHVKVYRAGRDGHDRISATSWSAYTRLCPVCCGYIPTSGWTAWTPARAA